MLRGGQSLLAANESGETCIHMAVSNSDEAMLNLLIAQTEAPVDTADRKGVRPVTIAVQKNSLNAFNTLYAKGTNRIGDRTKKTRRAEGSGECVRSWGSIPFVGADIAKINEKDQTTLLHNAVWAGHEDMVAVLLKTGIFRGRLLEAEDGDGRTALHHAAFRASEEGERRRARLCASACGKV